MTDKEALREAAAIMATLFEFAQINANREYLYDHERRALAWLAQQWERDPETQIGMWTGERVRALAAESHS